MTTTSPLGEPAASLSALGSDPRAAVRVFHDGGCPICRREIGWYRGMRGADGIEWVDICDAEAVTPLVPEGRVIDDLRSRFTIVRRDGDVVDGAEGFVALWRSLAPTRLIGRICDRTPFLEIAEVAYRGILRVRPLWRR